MVVTHTTVGGTFCLRILIEFKADLRRHEFTMLERGASFFVDLDPDIASGVFVRCCYDHVKDVIPVQVAQGNGLSHPAGRSRARRVGGVANQLQICQPSGGLHVEGTRTCGVVVEQELHEIKTVAVVHLVAEDDIKPAIAIKVAKSDARCVVCATGQLSGLLEGARAVVEHEQVCFAVCVGDHNVEVAVLVDVSQRDLRRGVGPFQWHTRFEAAVTVAQPHLILIPKDSKDQIQDVVPIQVAHSN